jgi:peroxiredoxin
MRIMTALRPGSQAPEFSLADIDGRRVEFRHRDGLPALLIFFKNSCPTCMLAFPYLQRLFERVETAPLRFLGISQDGVAETRLFGEQYGTTFPLLPDGKDYPVSSAFGLTNVPTLFLVEAGGGISWTSVGFSKADLEGLASELHRRFRIPGVTPLFVAADDAPEMKPG